MYKKEPVFDRFDEVDAWNISGLLIDCAKAETSSLAAAVELTLSDSATELWQRDEARYALCGGGFPIRVRGRGIVGVSCISGLPHLEDHRLLTSVLAHYLGVPSRAVPAAER